MIPDSAYTVVVVFPLAALRASPAEGQILLKTLMLMLVLYLCGNNNQWQQRVGCDCRGLGFQLKPSSIWSEPGPCFNNYCSPNYRCHISQSPTDYKHKHIHTMITCSLLQHFTKHPANPPFFFILTCAHLRSRSDKTTSKWEMCRRLCSCQSLWGAVMVWLCVCAGFGGSTEQVSKGCNRQLCRFTVARFGDCFL